MIKQDQKIGLIRFVTEAAIVMLSVFIKANKPYVPSFPPEHPGIILKEFVMVNFGLTADEVSAQSGISSEKLKLIFNGKADIDPDTRDKLRQAFGSAADHLYKHQQNFDYYAKNRKWPPPHGSG